MSHLKQKETKEFYITFKIPCLCMSYVIINFIRKKSPAKVCQEKVLNNDITCKTLKKN